MDISNYSWSQKCDVSNESLSQNMSSQKLICISNYSLSQKYDISKLLFISKYDLKHSLSEILLSQHISSKSNIAIQVWISKNFQREIVNIFLPIIFSIFFECSKELSHGDVFFWSTHNLCFGWEIRKYFSVTHSQLRACYYSQLYC